jgi:SAM-dependent methyltransferase
MADSRDHDWELIARRDPWFGVVSAPQFRVDQMTQEAEQLFYQSGETDTARVLNWFDQDLGARPTEGRALDIGCGVGRLACAMAHVMPEVVGYDISPTMIELARRRAPANLCLTTELPEGPFAWLNTYMVLQHIPPDEGLALLGQCLDRTGPGAFLSLQLTIWRDGPQPNPHALARLRRAMLRARDRNSTTIDGLIRMYDYNLSHVMQRVNQAGFGRAVLRPTNHGGHHGVWVISRRDP